ncbi:MAG TPA: hypothetical protein VGN16_02940, partial [Acidobacteriaceae bacterium]
QYTENIRIIVNTQYNWLRHRTRMLEVRIDVNPEVTRFCGRDVSNSGLPPVRTPTSVSIP